MLPSPPPTIPWKTYSPVCPQISFSAAAGWTLRFRLWPRPGDSPSGTTLPVRSITIHGSRVLVIGFGRVGRLTAQRFQALGARVSVAARKYDQLAWAQAMGMGSEHLAQLKDGLCGCDLVINTVPALVLGREELEETKEDCLILDLASKPGGVDLGAAGELGRTVIWCLSLPGKVSPVTAGAAIKTTIYNMLHELEY